MATSSYTVQLPAGTNKNTVLNIGYPGSWPGAVWVHWSSGVPWTMHFVNFIRPAPHKAPRTRSGGVAFPASIAAFYRWGYFLREGECVINFRYTSTQDVSFNFEANTAVKPTANP